MNREIKFRGKRVDNGEWEIGYIVRHFDISYIIPFWSIKSTDNGEGCDFEIIEVIPETVGQFTGLKDKNGMDIHERDRVRYWKAEGKTLEGIVVYHRGGFNIRRDGMIDCSLRGLCGVEVIGNIYDDKDLIK